MTFQGTRSRLRWRGSWAGVASVLLLLLFVSGCDSSPTASTASPSPSPSASATFEPSPTPSGDEVPVASQVLPPASDPPVANLCTAPITFIANGNVTPLLCKSGAVNVKAWQFYADISASVLGLGLNPTQGQVQSAMCDDIQHNHATQAEEASGYRLAATYYGWNFSFDPTRTSCQ
jgi:hypothetical protein